jgi:rod shape-determining protein MreD
MTRERAAKLTLRIAIVAFVAVLLQETVIAQISIFDSYADITPLVVMSIGLLCGSLPGAVAGFAIGLFVDLALLQTLGITSLLFIVIGYWSGRLRELSDLSHGLIPIATGAGATAVAGIGMMLIQFLLGVDAPISLLLIEQIVLQVLINSLIALPVYEIVRRILYRSLPDNSRRRHHSYTTTGSLSPLSQPFERARLKRAPR